MQLTCRAKQSLTLISNLFAAAELFGSVEVLTYYPECFPLEAKRNVDGVKIRFMAFIGLPGAM